MHLLFQTSKFNPIHCFYMYFCNAVSSFVHPNREFSFQSAGAEAGEKKPKTTREKVFLSYSYKSAVENKRV